MSMKEKIKQHLEILCKEIGSRPTGSQANLAAVEYACKEFETYGLCVQRQNFDCMDWTQSSCTLTIYDKEIPILPAPYSIACDVNGKLICVNSLDELRCAQITGKIVLLCGALASEPLMPKSFIFWNPDWHKETISLLEQGNPLAVLTVSLSSDHFVPVIEDGDFDLPCGIIMPESIPTFYDDAWAVLKINTVRKPVTAANVIATHGSGESKVCFSAHIDTKEGTCGALDNASGVAVLLALASELQNMAYPYRIEFVLFNGEDYYSNPGEMTYLASHLSHPEEYICAYNIDGVGLTGQNLSYSFYGCSEKLISSISYSAARMDGDGVEEIEPWPQGDHMLFSFSGVPTVAITSCGIFELVDCILHTASDTLEVLDIKKLELLVNFLLSLL